MYQANHRKKVFLIASQFLLALVILSTPAYGWLRPHFEDAIVVERSDLIVVGFLKEDSIRYVREQPGGGSWHYQAILIVTEVLKGKLDEKELPIIIHYGLSPVVGGYAKRDGGIWINLRGARQDYPEGIIEILDTGNSLMSFDPLVKDAREENLWFLRRDSKSGKRQKTSSSFGIRDPEDLQALDLKDYFLAYMDENPERAVRQQVAQKPELTKRAEPYFDHLEIQKILRLPHAEERVEKLLPFYIKGSSWNMEREARRAIIAGGKVSGPYLLRQFNETADENLREDIIRVFGEIGYEGCVDALISLLDEQDKFWATQILNKGWWNTDYESEVTQRRRDFYMLVLSSVYSLGRIGDGRARDTIIKIKQRWESLESNSQIVEACNQALKTFAAKEARN